MGADPAFVASQSSQQAGSTKGFNPGEGRIKRLLVCGGREFDGRAALFRELDRIKPDVVIEGDARGADRIAGYWARKNRIDNMKFRADWDTYGKAAGAIRNQQMIDEGKPDAVLACPGGRGTADMVRRARAACITVIHLVPTGANQ